MGIILFFLISFFASTVGVISGLGGGIIIKPVLDMSGLAGVAVASFMSGVTVLSMTTMNLVRGLMHPKSMLVDRKRSPFLAIGSIAGGFLGNFIYEQFMKSVGPEGQHVVGAVQAAILFLITAAVMLYMIKKDKIKTKNIQNLFVSLAVGLALGMISSFLGIGGGPMNLVVLYYFFSMSSKVAAQNSLFIIFCSQLVSLISTLVGHTVPNDLVPANLIVMIIGGIAGALLGGYFNKKMDDKMVDKLLMGVFTLILIINIYNFFKFII